MLTRLAIALCLVVAACSGDSAEVTTTAAATTSTSPVAGSVTTAPDPGLVDSDGAVIPPAPDAPTGPLDEATITAIDRVWGNLAGVLDPEAIVALGGSGDVRLAWLLSDLLRFYQFGELSDAAISAFNELTGAAVVEDGVTLPWNAVTDLLIAWDLPAPPGYAEYKEGLYTLVEPGWGPFFADTDADVDWRFVSWGGVLIDNRPLGDPAPCVRGCIPALDDPVVTDAAGGSWYPDDAIVFAVELNGEARAYPKNIMEIHEMVNDTLGGRRIGMPYCTLCGSAQAFFTDAVADEVGTVVLRTSGLLARSNKVMYELNTQSMFDTFLGIALTGPLREAGVVLEQASVVTTTWGEWKLAHPETTIVAQDGGIGRDYPADPLRGRDDAGPIFPIGDVDPRLPVQEQVLGVVAGDGTAIAFPAAAARDELESGGSVVFGGVELLLDGGGLRAVTDAGDELATHQAFWFAWSQFRPDTLLWDGGA